MFRKLFISILYKGKKLEFIFNDFTYHPEYNPLKKYFMPFE